MHTLESKWCFWPGMLGWACGKVPSYRQPEKLIFSWWDKRFNFESLECLIVWIFDCLKYLIIGLIIWLSWLFDCFDCLIVLIVWLFWLFICFDSLIVLILWLSHNLAITWFGLVLYGLVRLSLAVLGLIQPTRKLRNWKMKLTKMEAEKLNSPSFWRSWIPKCWGRL